jgi:hypothetical protein
VIIKIFKKENKKIAPSQFVYNNTVQGKSYWIEIVFGTLLALQFDHLNVRLLAWPTWFLTSIFLKKKQKQKYRMRLVSKKTFQIVNRLTPKGTLLNIVSF